MAEIIEVLILVSDDNDTTRMGSQKGIVYTGDFLDNAHAADRRVSAQVIKAIQVARSLFITQAADQPPAT